MGLRAIVLAAGQGTRMKSAVPKVLYEVAGKPMILWIIDALARLDAEHVAVVVGHERHQVEAVLPDWVTPVVQEQQFGTGHATRLALEAAPSFPGDTILVLPGDAPLVSATTIGALVERHLDSGAAATLLTTELADPTGYGRVIRSESGAVLGVVEHADATPAQRAICEVATSIYAFKPDALDRTLRRVTADNAQGEYYLPDVIGLLAADGAALAALAADAEEVIGINSLEHLAAAATMARRRINNRWMDDGVWMLDPDRVYIDASVELAAGVRLYPGVHLEGSTTVATGAEIGPDTHVRDSFIGEDASVRYSVLEGAEVGTRATVGPYARLRPGTVLGAESKAGTFVELKQTSVGDRSKVPHLTYMGDAVIGEDANIGAGSITCNWDGFVKSKTIIGDRTFVGSDTMLVAPVEIGDDAWTAAGSTITKDVPPGSLAVERSSQREVSGYSARRRRRAGKDRAEEQAE